MPKLQTRLSSETRRQCSSYPCSKPATGVRVVHQRIKANGVPPYKGFYPCCEDCRQRIEKAESKRMPQPGVSVVWRPL